MQLHGFHDASVILGGGVYALCFRGRVIYVGQSKACIARIATHRAQRGKKTMPWLPIKGMLFDEIHIFPCGPDTRDRVEREMIDRYRPKYNIAHKPTGPIRAPIAIEAYGKTFIFNRPEPAEPFQRRVF